MDTLTAGAARRLALAAQGLPADVRRPGLRTVLRRLGAVQIDSINVVARSHELVLASRAAAHGPTAFFDLVYRRRAGFEYWGHAASFLPMERYRLFLPRMRRLRESERGWFRRVRETYGELYPAVLERIVAEGPLPASAFPTDGRRRGSWWDWSGAKLVLEDLFDAGRLLVHDRVGFERRYDLAERVLPGWVDTTAPGPVEAAVELTTLAARALGVGTAADLADYFRLPVADARLGLAEALAAGLLREVRVDGWTRPAYLPARVTVPRRYPAEPVLLSPFDSLIWSRQRTERLFGFRYRLEVYVPAAKRLHGYYTMPVLAGDRMVARVDPKHDRAARTLDLRGLLLEPGVDPGAALTATAAGAWRLAGFLGAADVRVMVPDARLARALRRALAATVPPYHRAVPETSPARAAPAAHRNQEAAWRGSS